MIDPFERIRYVKSIIQVIYPKITHEEIKAHITNIVKAQQGTRKMGSERERVILDLMLQHRINLSTASGWYRVITLPAYLQEKIRLREISLKEALQLNIEANKPYKVLRDEIRKEIIEYVSQMAKNDFLRGDDYATN